MHASNFPLQARQISQTLLTLTFNKLKSQSLKLVSFDDQPAFARIAEASTKGAKQNYFHTKNKELITRHLTLVS